MPEADAVALETATEEDAALLGNLLELSVHDMSEVFPDVKRGPDDRPIAGSRRGRAGNAGIAGRG